MNYHNKIMNLPLVQPESVQKAPAQARMAYELGHRDARHSAAEVSLEAMREIEALNGKLNLISSLTTFMESAGLHINVDLVDFYEDMTILLRAVAIGNLVSWLEENPTVLRLRGYYGIHHEIWDYVRLEEE